MLNTFDTPAWKKELARRIPLIREKQERKRREETDRSNGIMPTAPHNQPTGPAGKRERDPHIEEANQRKQVPQLSPARTSQPSLFEAGERAH